MLPQRLGSRCHSGSVASVKLGMACEENCAVQEEVGDGDQGRWSTCAVYAVCGALRQVVSKRCGIDLEDTSDMAKRIIGMNLQNAQGNQLLQHGISISELIRQLNQKMTNGNLLFFEKTESGAPGAAIRLQIGHDLLDLKALRVKTPSDFQVYVECSNWIVHASGPNGTHRNHAMQCQQLLLHRPAHSLRCSNSWGGSKRHMTVPNPERYPTITALWVLSVHAVRKLSDPTSPWADVNLQEEPCRWKLWAKHFRCLGPLGLGVKKELTWWCCQGCAVPPKKHPVVVPWCPKCRARTARQ